MNNLKKDLTNEVLDNFRQAFHDLAELWSIETDLCDEILEEDYPFHHSFDELNLIVSEWIDNAKVKLQN